MKKLLVLVFSFLFIMSGCRGGGGGGNNGSNTGEDLSKYFDPILPTGTIEFTHSIMSTDDFSRIIPLGNINPPGHTFPTDHIYFVQNGIRLPVYAPAGGKILKIFEPSEYGDRGLRVGVTNTMAYYLSHIIINEDLQVGDIIEAGTQIGMSGNTQCVDFGVINKNINNAFISEKYPIVTLYGDKPLWYYNEPLRTQLYALVKPPQPAEDPDYVYSGGVTDGEFVLDQPGTLCGNWFREGCFSDGWYKWEDQLAFAYDNFYPDQIRIGIGKDIPYNNFAIKNEDNPTKPEDVTIASGAVAYYLYNTNNTGAGGLPRGERIGLMMVRMLSDTRIKLEIFNDTTSESREFTSAAWYYQR